MTVSGPTSVEAATSIATPVNKTTQEKQDFLKTFDETISKEILSDLDSYNLPKEGKEYYKEMLQYTVPHGKMNRGMTVLSAFKSIISSNNSNEEEPTEQDIKNTNILGWCIELLQAFFLVSDDIMDSSITRRGSPCWYKQQHVGLQAINDAFILESIIYKLLKKHFKGHPSYVEFIELFHEVTYKTELGQLMDLITAPEDKVDLSKFSMEKHAYIVEYKTAYYSFYLPVALAMLYNGITDPMAFKEALSILLPLGEYFQIQDDYLDCYGSPEVIGKIGTDILDNKCSWLINKALDIASPEQRKVLDENYGVKDSLAEARVKDIFKELNLQELYVKYEADSYHRITDLIKDCKILPKELFFDLMNRIYKRKK